MFSGFPLFPEQGSSVAADVDNLYFFLLAITAFFSTLIAGLVIYFAIRYRRRSEVELPEPITGSTKLETLWTVIPAIIVMVIFAWGAKSLPQLASRAFGRYADLCRGQTVDVEAAAPGRANGRLTSCTSRSAGR